jgi:lysyl-tRNA synthetase class 2
MEKESDLLARRREKLAALRQSGINPFPNHFICRNTVAEVLTASESAPETPGPEAGRYRLAGRIMAINRMGKASFIRFRDRSGSMQAYLRLDKVGQGAYERFRQMDIGDFVGLDGQLFRTRTGEWSLLANEVELVCKALRPLPEKFHGLKDPEKRYRRRYLDLMTNAEVREIFDTRSAMVQAIR